MYVDFQLNEYEIQSLVIYQNASYIYVINNLNWFVLSPLQVKPFSFISLPGYCPSCKEAGVSHQ